MKFDDQFNEPIQDIEADTGWAVSRECYSKEDAAELFEQAEDEQLGNTIPASEFMKTIQEGIATFGFGQRSDGETEPQWWWSYGEVTRKGQKKVWLAH